MTRQRSLRALLLQLLLPSVAATLALGTTPLIGWPPIRAPRPTTSR